MVLSNFQLEKLAKFYKLKINDICMKDELPDKVEDGSYIINLQSSFQGTGTHWCALFIDRKNAYYQDSFGAAPPSEVCNFVKKRDHCHLYYNNWIIQDLASNKCGWFANAFLLWMKEHYQSNMLNVFNSFVNHFSDDTSKNDDILKSFFTNPTILKKPSLLENFIK